ncbi:hypothetical protein [Actinomadura kijaniata]|uniref:hypothetical protein n=1 Tax=Actinomadura kijaniata TaxID=46161 RepID=UPI00082AB9CF|nr:hypothetical protein [Actinomadura kijaniata]
MPRTTNEPTEPAEVVGLAEQAAQIRAAREDGRAVPAGRLLGLPELPDGDVWVDIAGAAAITGLQAKTITGYLTKGGPKAAPFPAAHRFLYRLYWPLSEVEAWAQGATSIRR